jgi:hypothetical protein
MNEECLTTNTRALVFVMTALQAACFAATDTKVAAAVLAGAAFRKRKGSPACLLTIQSQRQASLQSCMHRWSQYSAQHDKQQQTMMNTFRALHACWY